MNAPVFFFTAEDPREIPKGSRDPLRFLPEWTSIARKMIPYLTTVTPSYRGFLTRFLFHGLLEEIAPTLANASADDQWPAFCKFEQLCALVRAELNPSTPNFPGISGVPGRVQDGYFTVGFETPFWLVRSQKNTGYWGYYHQASLGSGLIQMNKAAKPGYKLTEEASQLYRQSAAREIVSQYSDVFARVFKEKSLKLDLAQFEGLASLFAQQALTHEAAWGEFWFGHLLVPKTDSAKSYTRPTLQNLASELNTIWTQDRALTVGQLWETLAQSGRESVRAFASEVMAHEAMIGLCEWVFDVCRMKFEQGADLHVAAQWAYENGYNTDWLNRLRQVQAPQSAVLAECRSIALANVNSFESLAKVLLTRHKSVMTNRKGAAWVELHDDDVLNVRDPSDEPWCPNFDIHPSGIRWRYDYFLRPWLSVAREIGYLPETING